METPAPFILGIDPGASTGLAGYVPGSRGRAGTLTFVTSSPPLEALDLLAAWARDGVLLGAYVEDARALPIYARNRHAGRGERDAIARSVGQVDGLTGLYLDALEGLQIAAVPVEPSRSAKWDAETLERLTGFSGRTNEHGRDAARLVFGRPVPRTPNTASSPGRPRERSPRAACPQTP